MVEGTFPPHYSMPKEAGLRVVDYVNPVHNHVPVGACLAADGHIIHETRDSADNELHSFLVDVSNRLWISTLSGEGGEKVILDYLGSNT